MNTEWINAKDRLPENSQHVLVCLGDVKKYVDMLFFDKQQGFMRFDTEYEDYISLEIGEKVSHWMPLPELPVSL